MTVLNARTVRSLCSSMMFGRCYEFGSEPGNRTSVGDPSSQVRGPAPVAYRRDRTEVIASETEDALP